MSFTTNLSVVLYAAHQSSASSTSAFFQYVIRCAEPPERQHAGITDAEGTRCAAAAVRAAAAQEICGGRPAAAHRPAGQRQQVRPVISCRMGL